MVLLIGEVVVYHDESIENGGGFRLFIKYREDKGGSTVQRVHSSQSFKLDIRERESRRGR